MISTVLRNQGFRALVAAGKQSFPAWAAKTPVASNASVQPMALAGVRSFHASNVFCGGGGQLTEADIEHATGLELAELKAELEGVDLFVDEDAAWLNAPLGTLESPCVVTSSYPERIVGAADPHDDSQVVWAMLSVHDKEPTLIGGEYFVLKQLDDGRAGAHH